MSAIDDIATHVPAARRELPASLRTLRRSLRYGRMWVGISLTVVIVLVALIGPLVAPYSPSELVGPPYSSPSSSSPLGTDYLGQDVLSQVLWGGRTVLWMSICATAIGFGLGVLIGMVAGYSRSGLDDLLMRPLDIVMGFPQIVLVLLFVSMIGPKLWLIVLLVALAWVGPVARIARGITLDVVGREYIAAAEVLGVPRRRILRQEVLPNLSTPLMVDLGLRLTYSIALISALSFLGFGVQPPTADWGRMINENRNGLTIQPWAVVAPIVCIAIFTIGTNLIAEGIARTSARTDAGGER